jgi:hypothetical protein
MHTATITSRVSGAGIDFNCTLTREAPGLVAHEVELLAGKAGTLTTRTDENTGVATLSTGHGIESQDVVDVYWPGGLRYGMVATVSVNAVTIEGGTGDALPAAQSAVVLCEQSSIDTDFDGDLVTLAIAAATTRCHIDFQTVAPASLLAVELPANQDWRWADDAGVANPLAGNPVDTIKASNGDAGVAATLRLVILYQSV